MAGPIDTKLCRMFNGGTFGRPLPPEIWRTKNIKISARFRTTSRLDREYLRKATTHRQSENGFANYMYWHSRTGKLNLVYFCPQTAKTGPEFWPTQRLAFRLGIATHIVFVLLLFSRCRCYSVFVRRIIIILVLVLPHKRTIIYHSPSRK